MSKFPPFQRVQLRLTGEKPRTFYGYVVGFDGWNVLVDFDSEGLIWVSEDAVDAAPLGRRRARGLRP